METRESLLGRGFIFPGYEAGRLFHQDAHWYLQGTAVFPHDQQPCRLDYRMRRLKLVSGESAKVKAA